MIESGGRIFPSHQKNGVIPMKNFPKRILLALLLSVSILGLAACSATETTDPAVQEEAVSATEPEQPSQESTEAKTDDSLAVQCSKIWEQKWAEIELDGVVSNLEGRIFSVDFDNDQTDELVFLYDDDVSYQGVVYRLGDSIEELGGFTVSNTGSEFSFALYENAGKCSVPQGRTHPRGGWQWNRNRGELHPSCRRSLDSGKPILHRLQR